MSRLQLPLIGAAALAMTIGCATAPKSASDKASLEARADSTLTMMRNRDPALGPLLSSSAGYVVFPEIGKGGFVVGAAHGRGILYERGRHAGFVDVNQASIGAQLGAQTFSELVVFKSPFDVQKLKTGEFTLGANASAVALTTGAAASAEFKEGTAVFVVAGGGVMAELSLSGQRMNFVPRG